MPISDDDSDEYSGGITRPRARRNQFSPKNSINSMYNTATTNPSISMPISDDNSGKITRPRGKSKSTSNEFRSNTELTRLLVRQLAKWWALIVFLLSMALLAFVVFPLSRESSSEFTRSRPSFVVVENSNLNRLDHEYNTVARVKHPSEQDIKEFFSFSGDIEHVEIQSENERCQTAYVTFKEAQGAETAALLSGATIVDQAVTIALAPDYNPPAATLAPPTGATIVDQAVTIALAPDYNPPAATLAPPTGATIVDQAVTIALAPDYNPPAATLAPPTGATIVDQAVTIALAPDYNPPAATLAPPTATKSNLGTGGSPVQKAENVVTSMLARGFVLGKDALKIAKAFDETHQFTSTAAAKIASIDQKIGLSEKITLVNEKMREVDQKFHVSETTKSAFEAAEQTLSSAGSAIMKNRYILTGTSWVTGAFNRVVKTAEDVSQKTREKSIGGRKMKKRGRGLL